MADEAYVTALPTCDIHWHTRNERVSAAYDAKTISGPWANMCADCFQAYGVGLGTGKGQRLILGTQPAPDPERLRSQILAAISAGDLAMAEDLIGDGDLGEYL